MSSRRPLLGVLVFYGAVVTASLLLVVLRRPAGPDRTSPVGATGPEALHVMQSLSDLARRIEAHAPRTTACLQLTLYPSGPTTASGLLVATQRDSGFAPTGLPETQLAMTFYDSGAAIAPRSPRDAARPQACLARDDARSDLWTTGSDAPWPTPLAMAIRLEPEGRVQVSNHESAGRRSVASARSGLPSPLAPFAAASHGPTLRTLDLLARVLRARICGGIDPVADCQDTLILLAPAGARDEYLVQLEALPGPHRVRSGNRWRFRLSAPRGPAGVLERGTLRLVSGADDDRALASLFVTRPVAPGELLDPAAPGFAALHIFPVRQEGRIDADLALLLGGTRWNEPVTTAAGR